MTITLTEREEAMRRALDLFGARVRSVGPGRWHDPTPCADWDVRALVNHVVVEQMWVPPLLAGQTIADVGSRFDGDQLGDDPVSGWMRAAEAARTAWDAPGAWDRTVAVSVGPTPAAEYASQLTFDLLVHGWDLAKAIGADEPSDPGLIRLALAEVEPQAEVWRAAGIFGPAPDVPADADEFTRLLALTGRRGDWAPPS